MRWQTTCALAAVVLAIGALPVEAGKRPRKPTKQSVSFETLDGSDARGKATVVDRARGRKISLRFRGLSPNATYDLVADGAFPIPLGTVESNRNGRARLRLRDAPNGIESLAVVGELRLSVGVHGSAILRANVVPADADGDAARPLEDPPALVDPPEIDLERLPGARVATVDGVHGHSVYLSVLSTGNVLMGENLSMLLSGPDGSGGTTRHAFQRRRDMGEDLPLNLERGVDLATRGFEIRDPAGDVAVSGTFPKLLHKSEFMFLFMESRVVALDDGTRNTVRIPAAGPASGYTLWVVDDAGVLTRVGDFLEYPAWPLGVRDGNLFKGWDGNTTPPPRDDRSAGGDTGTGGGDDGTSNQRYPPR